MLSVPYTQPAEHCLWPGQTLISRLISGAGFQDACRSHGHVKESHRLWGEALGA